MKLENLLNPVTRTGRSPDSSDSALPRNIAVHSDLYYCRVPKACTHCRREKSRCDLRRPCHNCVKRNRSKECVDGCYPCRQMKKMQVPSFFSMAFLTHCRLDALIRGLAHLASNPIWSVSLLLRRSKNNRLAGRQEGLRVFGVIRVGVRLGEFSSMLEYHRPVVITVTLVSRPCAHCKRKNSERSERSERDPEHGDNPPFDCLPYTVSQSHEDCHDTPAKHEEDHDTSISPVTPTASVGTVLPSFETFENYLSSPMLNNIYRPSLYTRDFSKSPTLAVTTSSMRSTHMLF